MILLYCNSQFTIALIFIYREYITCLLTRPQLRNYVTSRLSVVVDIVVDGGVVVAVRVLVVCVGGGGGLGVDGVVAGLLVLPPGCWCCCQVAVRGWW